MKLTNKKIDIKKRKSLVLKYYKQGLTPKQIAAKKFASYHVILRDFKLLNLKMEGSGGKNRLVEKCPFKDKCKNSDYWLGYIAGDGNLGVKHSIVLTSKDIKHLESYIRFVDAPLNIHIKKGTQTGVVTFQNKDSYRWLESKGITLNKSLTLKFSTALNWDIIRGLFDADGHVSSNDRINPYILTGSESLKNQLSTFLTSEEIDHSVYIHDKKAKKIAYNVVFLRSTLDKVYDKMYINTNYFLDRKHTKLRLSVARLKANWVNSGKL